MRERDFARADSLQRLIASGTTDTLMMKLLAAHYHGDARRQQELYALYAAGSMQPTTAATFLASLSHMDAAVEYAKLAGSLARNPAQEARATRILGSMAMQAGRFSDAFELFHRADGSTPRPLLRAEAAAFHWVRLSRADALRLQRELERADTTQVADASSPLTVLRDHFRFHALAVAALQLGDDSAALAYADSIDARPRPEHWDVPVRALAEYIRSRVEANRGDPAAALQRLERLPADLPLDLLPTSADRAAERLFKVDLLIEAGRDQEALRWLDDRPVVPLYNYTLPIVQLRMAQILERSGNMEAATALYAAVLRQWRDADTSLQPLVQFAERGLR